MPLTEAASAAAAAAGAGRRRPRGHSDPAAVRWSVRREGPGRGPRGRRACRRQPESEGRPVRRRRPTYTEPVPGPRARAGLWLSRLRVLHPAGAVAEPPSHESARAG